MMVPNGMVPQIDEDSLPPIEDGQFSSGAFAREKWGASLYAGFQIIPNVLFRCQKLLGLDPVEVVVLLNITTHWWEREDLPHPRPSVIAKRMNVSTRTVERHIVALQRKGFLRRLTPRKKGGRMVRPFDLGGLVEKLKAVSTVNLVRRRMDRQQPESAGAD